MIIFRILILTLGFALASLYPAETSLSQAKKEKKQKKEKQKMVLVSKSFSEGEMIPKEFTCVGKDISPVLSWKGAPNGTKSFALICDDPDAPMGTWVHWVIWNIPAKSTGLPEGMATKDELADGTRQGKNDFRRIGYGGPCPPPGAPHRYFFKLYALNALLDLRPGATKKELLKAMKGHILAEARLIGKFKR